ncbi:MAG TPA: hypothetical protein VJY85_00865 [Candidatus Limnocylindria bacterium]|nr:hypothetical protein [Candidatus Limnocylindria bacterium]
MSATTLYADPATDPKVAEATAPKGGPASPGYTRDLDEAHTRLVRWFEESENTGTDARDRSNRDRDYVTGIQWTQAELKALNDRHQPPITINYCSRKVELMCGIERKSRTDPKAYARNPADEDKAYAATQVLRYIADQNKLNAVRSAVYENMLVEGAGGAEVGLEDDGNGGAEVTITAVPWDRLWWDPHSRLPDFGDARYKGLVIWLDRDQAHEMWPDAADVITDSFATRDGSYDDRPDQVTWCDSTRSRVRVVQCHWDEGGTWWSATYTRSGFLASPIRSPFLNHKGKSACGLVMHSAHVDRENNRYGMVRDMISLQDEINKRRSKALHLLSVAQVITEKGAVQDIDKARREVAKPDGAIEVMPGMRFEIHHGGEMATGQMHLLQHATSEMQATGPNASMSGTDNRELSGRAILAQQAGGAAQNEPIADGLREWMQEVYEIVWMAARQYWTGGKWVRVTDDLGTTKYVGINQPVTLQDELAQMPDQQRAMAMQQLQIMPGDPRLQMVVRVENDITDMDIDVTIGAGLDVPSLQNEQFQVLLQLASTQPGLIPADVLIAASSLHDKDKLLERMKAHAAEQQQKEQEIKPIIMAQQQADLDVKKSKAEADFALAAERRHASVHHIQQMHEGYNTMMAPPDAPSAQGTVVPPEVQAALDVADIRGRHAKATVDEARANDLRHSAVERVANVQAMMQQAQQPQGPAP